MHAAGADDAVRVIVLTGAGRAFCAGGDITGFKSRTTRASCIDKLPRAYDFSRRPDYQSRATYFPSIPKPIIAMLNGATAGLGLVHALFCDVRFAAEERRSRRPSPASVSRPSTAWHGSESRRRPRQRARPAALGAQGEGRRGTAARSREPGASRASSWLEATYAYAREMADPVSPRSTRVIKQQLWDLPFQTLHEAVITDSDEMLRSNVCEDFQEGKRAFMEKRTPSFTGR